MNKLNFKNTQEHNNQKESLKWFKGTLAALLAAFALNQPANAKDSNLEQALKAPEGYKIEKVYKLDSNDSKMIVFKKNEYEPNLKAYWVWQQVKDNVYNWVGIRFDGPNYQTVIEKWGKYILVWWVYKFNFTNKVYSKFWASYLKLKDYIIWATSINPEQKSIWFAFGYWSDNLNTEIWHIRYYLDWANDVDGVSWKNYVELLSKFKNNLWTNYLIVSAENAHALWETKNSAKFTYQYQPNNDTQLGINYDTTWAYTEHDYKVEAGIEYKFGSKKISPYFKWTYNLPWEHTQVSATYEKWIWDKSIQMKDEFENSIMLEKDLFVVEIARKKVIKKLSPKFTKPVDQNITDPEPIPETPTLEDIKVIPWENVKQIDKIDETHYKVWVDWTTVKWTVIVEFEWNKWTEKKTVSSYRDEDQTVCSDTYKDEEWNPICVYLDYFRR